MTLSLAMWQHATEKGEVQCFARRLEDGYTYLGMLGRNSLSTWLYGVRDYILVILTSITIITRIDIHWRNIKEQPLTALRSTTAPPLTSPTQVQNKMAYNHLSISKLESLIKDLKGYKSIGASIGAKPSTSTKTISELSSLSDAELLARINKFESSRISSKKK
jgi:hypothetical protein